MRSAREDFQLAIGMSAVFVLTCLPSSIRPGDGDLFASTAALVAVTCFQQRLSSRLLLATTCWLLVTGSVAHRHAQLTGLGREDALRALLLLVVATAGAVRRPRTRYRRLPVEVAQPT